MRQISATDSKKWFSLFFKEGDCNFPLQDFNHADSNGTLFVLIWRHF